VSDHDLVVADATLRGRDGRWRIGVDGGRISTVTADAVSGREEVDAAGALVTESFVNGHLHLDKVHTLDRIGDAALTAYTAGDMASALTSIELASAVKADYDRSWIEPNARRAVDDAVRHGVRHVLAFADVDTKARLEGVIPLLALREEFRGVVDLQVVAFPQDGLLRDPGAEELVREAVGLGADVVGGIPWIEHTDAEAHEHVRRMCALAASHGRRVAMLVDDAGDPTLRTTEMLATAMLEHGLVGRGVANHARAIGLYPRPTLERLAGLARRAGLGFVSDPHTGSLHLPVRELTAMGLPVALGQDDIEDAYYPFGRHSMLEVAFLAAHALGAFDQPGLDLVYDAVTTTAATVLGIPDHRLEPGGSADLVVHHHPTVREVLAHHAPPAHVVASGKVVA
jgi:cytosine deaminase